MNNKILLRAGNIIAELLCAAAVTFSVVPAFLLTGNLLFQTAATLIIVLLFVLIADRLGVKAVTFAHSLAVMSSFWTFFALFKQIQYKASVGDKSIWFYHFFYYDKPAMLYVAFCVIILFYIIKLLFKNNDEAYVSDYKKFMRITLICFFIYYILTLIYSFFFVPTACCRPQSR